MRVGVEGPTKAEWHVVRLSNGAARMGGGTATAYEKGARANVVVVLRMEDILVDEVCARSIHSATTPPP